MHFAALRNLGDCHIYAFADHFGPDIRFLRVLSSNVLQEIDTWACWVADRHCLLLLSDILGGWRIFLSSLFVISFLVSHAFGFEDNLALAAIHDKGRIEAEVAIDVAARAPSRLHGVVIIHGAVGRVLC